MSTDQHILVLAHEPGLGWIIFAEASNLQIAEKAEEEALSNGFDAVEFA